MVVARNWQRVKMCGISQSIQSFNYKKGINPRDVLQSMEPVGSNSVLNPLKFTERVELNVFSHINEKKINM